MLLPWKYKYISTDDKRNKKLKQTKYFIQYLKKLQFRNNKYNFKYCHNITCYLIMMIQNGWLNVFENFQLLWCQDLLIKYALADSWSNFSTMPKECVSWCADDHDARRLQKKSTINAQYPQKLCMKYNKYFKHNPNAFFLQLVRVVIIIYKKYISVIQNISSKTWERRFNG